MRSIVQKEKQRRCYDMKLRYCSHGKLGSVIIVILVLLIAAVAILASDIYLNTNYSMLIFNDLKNTFFAYNCQSTEYSANVTHTVADLCTKYNSMQMAYVLDFGTLLGAMRNGRVIPWDHDCDFSIIHFDETGEKVHRRRLAGERSRRCDHFHRTFNQSDVDNDELCIYDFSSDGQAFHAMSNLMNRRVPCKYLTETVDLLQVFPDSEWKHCKVPKQFNEVLTHYYGSHWNTSWQQKYEKCG